MQIKQAYIRYILRTKQDPLPLPKSIGWKNGCWNWSCVSKTLPGHAWMSSEYSLVTSYYVLRTTAHSLNYLVSCWGQSNWLLGFMRCCVFLRARLGETMDLSCVTTDDFNRHRGVVECIGRETTQTRCRVMNKKQSYFNNGANYWLYTWEGFFRRVNYSAKRGKVSESGRGVAMDDPSWRNESF